MELELLEEKPRSGLHGLLGAGFGDIVSPAGLLLRSVVSIVLLDAAQSFNARTHKSIKSDYRLLTGVNSDFAH